MAELVFYYGSMGCSKSANALMLRFQYLERGLKVWLIKPKTDTRDGEKIIKSRVGLEAEVDYLVDSDLLERLPKDTNLVICDEAQFLSSLQVDQLKQIAEEYNIPVYCYGLRTDFKTHLFEGSKRLFELCSKAIELESICSCGKPAIINGRFRDGKLVTDGEQIELGGNEMYKPLCYSCWKKIIKDEEHVPGIIEK